MSERYVYTVSKNYEFCHENFYFKSHLSLFAESHYIVLKVLVEITDMYICHVHSCLLGEQSLTSCQEQETVSI